MIRDLLQAAIKAEVGLAEVAPGGGQEVRLLIGRLQRGFGLGDHVQDPVAVLGSPGAPLVTILIGSWGGPLLPGSLDGAEDWKEMEHVLGSGPFRNVIADIETHRALAGLAPR